MNKNDAPEALLAAASMARPMTRNDVTELVVEAKIKQGLTWDKIAATVGASDAAATAATASFFCRCDRSVARFI